MKIRTFREILKKAKTSKKKSDNEILKAISIQYSHDELKSLSIAFKEAEIEINTPIIGVDMTSDEGKELLKKKEDLKKELTKEVLRLAMAGYASPYHKVYYDFNRSKYILLSTETREIEHIYSSKDEVRMDLRDFYPQSLLSIVLGKLPTIRYVFNPHKGLEWVKNSKLYGNLFVPSDYMKLEVKDKIKAIEWNRYPHTRLLLDNVFPKYKDYFVNWLAYSLQNRDKPRTAIVSYGVQGTGKGVIFEYIIKKAYGEAYTTLLDNNALESRFNGELEGNLFVLANEITLAKKTTANEKLKMLVTDENIRAEEKNLKARIVKNYNTVWITSNHTNPIQIQVSDRRFTVIKTSNTKLNEAVKKTFGIDMNDFLYELEKETDSFLRDLMALEVDVKLATTPLNTREKENIREVTNHPQELLKDKIIRGEIDRIVEDLEEFLEDNSKEATEKREAIKDYKTTNDKGEEIKGLLAVVYDTVRLKNEYIEAHERGSNKVIVKSSLLVALYKIFVSHNGTNISIGKRIGSIFNSRSYTITSEGKSMKVREIEIAPL